MTAFRETPGYEQVTTVYRRITLSSTKKSRCPICQGLSRRTRTFGETVSQFNRNDDGTRATEADIRVHLAARAAAWTPDFRHTLCTSTPTGDRWLP